MTESSTCKYERVSQPAASIADGQQRSVVQYSVMSAVTGFRDWLNPRIWWNTAAVALLSVALFLRLSSIDYVPMWVDEAESGINALTILQRGVPTDTYLGLPIFENTHILPWPDSQEYRYRDVSYSKDGLAVYHGWIPLYSMAAAFWAAGIQPDELTLSPGVQHASDKRRMRTVVPRLPAVVFGIAGVFLFYATGKVFSGTAAGVAAAVIAASFPMHIYVSQQARYFSATVTLSVLCAYATWQLLHRDRWRDCILSGIAFGALFHTHVLTFSVAAGMLILAALVLPVHGARVPWSRVLISGCITAVIILPWILATGFLYTATMVPAAWRLMDLPGDLIPDRFVLSVPRGAAVFAAVGAGLALLRYRGYGKRLASNLAIHTGSLIFLSAWLVVSYVAFIFLIPAASYALTRMAVLLLAPATLLFACMCAAVARSVRPQRPAVTAGFLALLPVAVSHYVWPAPSHAAVAMQHADIDIAVSYIASLPPQPMRRLYANPNDHLLLTYYSGVPVQSITPVRREFLDGYEGDVVLITRNDFFVRPGDPIDPVHLQRAARQHGVVLSSGDSIAMSFDLATHAHRLKESLRCARVVPPPAPVPDFAAAGYSQWLQLRDERERDYAAKWVRFPIFRGFSIRTISDWWTVFFLRFVNPETELLRPNYETRLRQAVATPLQGSNWTVYYSPGGEQRVANQ